MAFILGLDDALGFGVDFRGATALRISVDFFFIFTIARSTENLPKDTGAAPSRIDMLSYLTSGALFCGPTRSESYCESIPVCIFK